MRRSNIVSRFSPGGRARGRGWRFSPVPPGVFSQQEEETGTAVFHRRAGAGVGVVRKTPLLLF